MASLARAAWAPWARARASAAAERDLRPRAILVPITAEVPAATVATAGQLAAGRGAVVELMAVVEVPVAMPLDASLPGAELAALALLDQAQAVAEADGARVITYCARARHAGQAIVDEAARMGVDAIVLSAPAERRAGRPLTGATADFVMRHRPCRVVVAIEAPHVRRR